MHGGFRRYSYSTRGVGTLGFPGTMVVLRCPAGLFCNPLVLHSFSLSMIDALTISSQVRRQDRRGSSCADRRGRVSRRQRTGRGTVKDDGESGPRPLEERTGQPVRADLGALQLLRRAA